MAGKMLEKITSTTNSQIKEATKLLQKKYRQQEQKFLVEGYKSIEMAYSANYFIEKVFVLEENLEKYDFIKNKIIPVTQNVMTKITTTVSPPDACAVVKMKNYEIKDFLRLKKLILLENIKDAGNLGTIIRSACAFDFDGLILVGDTIDQYNGKVLRSSVGTSFLLPIINIKNLSEIDELLNKFQVISTSSNFSKAVSPVELELKEKFIISFGSEANGITSELEKKSNNFLKIHHNQKVESLNLGVAASIIIYDINKNF